jgi:single-strand DNA-binding protein
LRCKPKHVRLRLRLFRAALGLLLTGASIHYQGGAEMPSTKTSSPNSTATYSDRAPRRDSVNQVTLVGRLVAAPEMRQTASGTHVTTVRVATNDRNGAEFHDVVLWGQLADFATSYLGKGRLVYVRGRLQSRSWQASDGSTRRVTEIVADRLQALTGKEPAHSAA